MLLAKKAARAICRLAREARVLGFGHG